MNRWLEVAEILDAYRIIPRIILIAVYSFVAWYTYEFTLFYFDLIEKPEVSDWKLAAYTAFGGLTIPAIVGLAKGMTDTYMHSGRDWFKEGQITSRGE